jgi:CheY-like chemotaxis protein
MDGWAVLDRLKHDPATRHIPVHIVSIVDEEQRGLKLGAIAQMRKPVTKESLDAAITRITDFIERPIKNLLVVQSDDNQRHSVVDLIGYQDINIVAVGTGEDAIKEMKISSFDCTILDLDLPDMTGFQLIERIEQEQGAWTKPVIVYTGRALNRREETQLKKLAKNILIKDVRSMERLLDETALLLHRVEANLPEEKRMILESLHKTNPTLESKKVLIVDDDIRNIFAMASVLERYDMEVIYAENGRDGIEKLKSNKDIDLVLMDIMMPDMDGYETMQAIRSMSRFKTLPIIALTAKAMQGDREKCLEAGASDYVPKPVDVEHLLSVLRVWLYK